LGDIERKTTLMDAASTINQQASEFLDSFNYLRGRHKRGAAACGAVRTFACA